MASEMVERVAKAIIESEGVCLEDAKNWEKEMYYGMARAAIEAMRQPTQAMHEAAADFHRSRLSTPAEYRHMIDAALKD